MKAVAISDLGLHRKKNEDSYLINQALGLFVVCDGMGGHRGGDIASQMAINTIDTISREKNNNEAQFQLFDIIHKANEVIWKRSQDNPEWDGMGTTITAALVENDKLTVANVGDSSLYIIRNKSICKVTKDHTLAEQMVKEGLLSIEEMRSSSYNHILTRALGVEENVVIDFFEEQLEADDLILICSDGLSDMLDENEILGIIMEFAAKETELDMIVRTLLRQALNRGGYDNITIVMLQF
ncbi:MAG: Stp1/IreP family PP2C-type Ser/Thr phosphatase [Syntrophomonadaceae bacterium]|nr:Stp1/IreP family PP2C-type Ser/Thr phosphatase [Syntrophomonadaceae bacterium]MDD3022634.1 Stp1/IreP family PP2C-type Ser/Thr phosphatase [Syntrophomonadaceae bacterium]